MKISLYSTCLLWITILLTTCGSTNTDKTENAEKRVAIEERLMAELSPSNDRAGQQRNELINFAIDRAWDVGPAEAGYFYEIRQRGEGDLLQWGDLVRAHYKGMRLDGTVFNDSRLQGGKLDFYVGAMIPAWNDALQKVRPGASLRLLVPSDLAYGEEGLQTADGEQVVAPHTTMAFEIDEVELVRKAKTD
ncbi:MAG: FKBP-type peptidyl-prolyl cis-trans isomerase [Bacteroidota bacterium]